MPETTASSSPVAAWLSEVEVVLLEAVRVEEHLQPRTRTDAVMVRAAGTDAVLAVDLLAVEDLVTTVALHPEVFERILAFHQCQNR
jgi:hypothetical protein